MGTAPDLQRRTVAVVWVGLSFAFGVGLGFLSLEMIGLFLVPVVVAALFRVAGKKGHATASLLGFVAGYELTVAFFAWRDLVESRDPAVTFFDPVGLIVYMLVIAGVGLLVLGVGLRIARRTGARARLREPNRTP